MRLSAALTLGFAAAAAATADLDFTTEVEVSSTIDAAVRSMNPVDAVASYGLSKTAIVRDDSDCRECVRHVSEHIVRETVEHIREFCEKAECPVIKAHCEFMAEHQELTVGILVARMRPAQSAFGYCMGKGSCEHPGAANATVPLEQAAPVEALEQFNALLDSSDDFAALVQAGGDSEGPDMDELDDLEDEEGEADDRDGHHHRRHHGRHGRHGHHGHHGHHDDHECGRCIGFVSHHVMRGVVGGIRERCESTECPVMKRWCAWAREHFDFVLGTLLVHVEPAKFGVGACIADHRCEHGHRHHHHDHDGDGDSDEQ